MSDQLRIITLGGLTIECGGAPVEGLASRKAEALLIYLACNRRAHARDVLADLLWDDMPPDRARGNLSVLLTSLRQQLGLYIRITRQSVAFDTSAPYWLDVAELEARIGAARARQQLGGSLPAGAAAALEQALALYRGDFLHGFALRGAAGFETWLLAEQDRLRQLTLASREALVISALDRGAYDIGIAQATSLLQLDPLHEETHWRLMLLLAYNGQRAAALAHYHEYCRLLEQELGAAPAPRATEIYRQIWRGELANAHHTAIKSAPALLPRTPDAPRARPELRGAPFQPTSFVGRKTELAQIAERLASPDCRLLTLVGPGGIGKTRLAIRAAADRARALDDGAVFVGLASVSSHSQIVPAIAAAFGFTFRGQQNLQDQLLGYLRERQALLLLDNLEHLSGAADLIHAILSAAPRVSILATSRERLNLQAEWLFDLAGLEYPHGDAQLAAAFPDPSRLEALSAVQLFTQRAAQVRPGFALDDASAPAIVRICQVLDGMPLGIELAAAWVRAIPSQRIAAEISRSLDLLTTSLHDVPDRQRSLRATFDYSWELLTAIERAVLCRSAVFRGGFTLASAAAVCSDLAFSTADAGLSAVLDALNAKSLLRRYESGRYELHELLRQFAAERLEALEATDTPPAPGVAQRVYDRHCAHYLGFVAARAADLRGAAPQQAAAALRPDLDNIRQAWRWAVDQARANELAQGIDGLAHLYDLSGLFDEGEAAFGAAAERFLARIAPTPDPAELAIVGRLLVERARFLIRRSQYDQAARILHVALDFVARTGDGRLEAMARHYLGETFWRQSSYDAARQQLDQAITLARAAGLRDTEALSLRFRGGVAYGQGNYSEARAYLAQALDLTTALGDALSLCRLLSHLGSVAEHMGDCAEARDYFERALALAREFGDRWSECIALGNLGNVARDEGDYADAYSCHVQALHIYRELGDRFGEGIALFSLGNAAIDRGDYIAAEALYRESHRLCCDTGDRLGEGVALMSLGLTAHYIGNDDVACELGEQALGIIEEVGARRYQARVRVVLGYALAGLGRHADATAAYRQALSFYQQLGVHRRELEPLAGLVGIALAEGDLTRVRANGLELFNRLQSGLPIGLSEPFLVYLTCYRALQAIGDPRAETLIATAQRLLLERAGRIGDIDMRRSFLERVAAHRTILGVAVQSEI